MIRYPDSASSVERLVVGDQKVASHSILNSKFFRQLFGTPTTAGSKIT